VVDAVERLGRRRGVVGPARLLGELLHRSRGEPLALDRDDVDRRSRVARGADRVRKRRVAPRLVAVGDDDHDPPRERLARERVGGEDERVVERRALDAVHRDRPKRRVRVDRGRREAGQEHRSRRERGDRDPVLRRLRRDERARGGDRVDERLPFHRDGAVDRDDDALRAAEVLGLEPRDHAAVLRHAGRQRAGRRGLVREADLRERRRVEPLDLGTRRGRAARGREREGERGCDERAPHENPP
jgi:hypothetical protein